ncbi:MAG: MATE family efflux transporter [Dehalococcoidales bacterium]|nr:MATE family efflux transporter [Dehalococcoidales bacterium]
MQDYTKRLGEAPLGKLIIALSLPGIISTITTSLYNIIDTIWVARIGHEAIAALTISFPYQILFYAIGGGTGIGISALVSRRFGEKNLSATNHAAGQIFFLSAFWGLIFLTIAVCFADRLLPLMGATPDIFDYSRIYFIVTSYAAPMIILALCMSSLFRGSGDAVKPMVIMVVGTVINIILDPFMILGIGPFPEMGVAGAAWATFISQACAMLLGMYFFFARKTAYRIKFSHILPNWQIIKDIYRVGAPTAVFQFVESIIFLLLNTIISMFGSVALAALGLIMRISDLAYMPIMGVSHGLLPIIGYCFGEGNYKRLWDALKKATLYITILLVGVTVLIEIFAPNLIGIFTQERELLDIAVTAMRISMISMVLIGFSVLVTTTLQGLSKGMMALFLSFTRQFIVFLPALYLCRYLWGLTGVWISWPIADALSAVVSFIFIWWEYRKYHGKSGPLPLMQK